MDRTCTQSQRDSESLFTQLLSPQNSRKFSRGKRALEMSMGRAKRILNLHIDSRVLFTILALVPEFGKKSRVKIVPPFSSKWAVAIKKVFVEELASVTIGTGDATVAGTREGKGNVVGFHRNLSSIVSPTPNLTRTRKYALTHALLPKF